MTDIDMQFTITCGGAPLVIEGTIGEHALFYRSRHESWHIELDDKLIASGRDENGVDSQSIAEALRLIGVHCYRPIWDTVNAREEIKWEQS